MTFNARGLYASSSKVPRRRRFGWLVVGAVVGLLALGLGVLSMLGNVSTSIESRRDVFPAASAVEIDNETTGSVVVRAGEGDEITVDRERHGSRTADPHEEIGTDDGRLEIEAGCQGFLSFGPCAVDYVVEVPEGVAVDITTSVGPIEVIGVTGDVQAESDVGSITLRDVEGAIDLESDTGSIEATGSGPSATVSSEAGTVDLEGFAAAAVEVETDIGDILVGAGFTTATVRTEIGSVRVGTDQGFESLVVGSDIGAVDIRVPDAEYRVVGESDMGERTVEVDTSADAAALIDVETEMGSVDIRPN
ncbi:DUF4097 family beta strand repeat-containing protein [Actinorugispora endophytica]|uniref:Putative adhesin n=1 Tax=Actinorugispora endophytica TaxID=1605990 RepID=A0A4R6V4K5_9ACTN|nr:DUF4097 family beta strand repeat-containing protein [Actinorugispora endophytica]TDQ53159.1 putative adhesin [Actinorugispora endophytica]